jgi:hypothetical protein
MNKAKKYLSNLKSRYKRNPNMKPKESTIKKAADYAAELYYSDDDYYMDLPSFVTDSDRFRLLTSTTYSTDELDSAKQTLSEYQDSTKKRQIEGMLEAFEQGYDLDLTARIALADMIEKGKTI